MTFNGWLQIAFYLVVLMLLVKPLGLFMARVYQGERTFLTPVVGAFGALLYRLVRIDPAEEMDWKAYALTMLIFNLIGFVFVYLLQRVQGFLPLNPRAWRRCRPTCPSTPPSALPPTPTGRITAARTTMSYLTQMVGLTVQNFVSAAAGMAILVAFIRAFVRHNTRRWATSGST